MYKKTHILSLFLLVFQVLAFNSIMAQDFDNFYIDPDLKEDLDIGLRMGVAYNALNGDRLVNARPVIRFTGAVYNRVKLASKLSLYHELGVSFTGARFNFDGDSAIERFALIYLDLPVGLEYTVKEKKVSNRGKEIYRVFLGFQPSILLRSTMFYNSSGFIGSDFNLPFTRMNYAVVVGMPVVFPVGEGKMGFSTYLKIGVHNVDDNLAKYEPSPNLSNGSVVKTVQWSLNITF